MLGKTVFEEVYGPITSPGENLPADNDPLRYMDSTKESECHYCTRTIKAGLPIAGHYGILWGHRLCVQTALLEGELILSPNNKERRPLSLKFLANRVYTKSGVKTWMWRPETTVKHFEELKLMVERGQKIPQHILSRTGLPGSLHEDLEYMKRRVLEALAVPKELLEPSEPSGRAKVIGTRTGRLSAKSPNWSNSPRYPDQNINDDHGKVDRQDLADGLVRHGMMDAPTSDCDAFKPIFVCRHKIPKDMRPSEAMLKGDGLVLDSPSIEEIIRRMKEEEFQRRYEKWKFTQHTLPSCPAHTHLKVVVVPVPDGRYFDSTWEADIWLVCAHKGKEHRAYQGYELL